MGWQPSTQRQSFVLTPCFPLNFFSCLPIFLLLASTTKGGGCLHTYEEDLRVFITRCTPISQIKQKHHLKSHYFFFMNTSVAG